MLRRISESQLNIAANSEQTSIFPAAMTNDMQNMQARITAIQNKVREIGAKPINLVTAADSAMLEQLRGQLAGITSEQGSLNAAVEAMDVIEANQAYLRLSQTVGNTERYIRDNAAAQERFNRKIDMGIGASDKLMNSIKGVAAAYLSVQSLGKMLNLSDEMSQTAARLDIMNDGLQSTENLQNMIFRSAERSRGAYQTTTDAVAKLGLMAGDAFGSSAEVVAFMEQINKQFTIAGTNATGIDAAMLQLTQAMGSGVLRGEEFNSVFEQSPNIIETIANYFEVPKGKLKEMAGEGEITAGIVKAAMFAAAEETNAKFESMPMTFEQVWTSFENRALMAFQPLLDRLGEIANSKEFQKFVDDIVGSLNGIESAATKLINIFANNLSKIEKMVQVVVKALNLILVVAAPIVDMVFEIAEAIIDNWSIVEFTILAVAAAIFIVTAAQHGLNAAFAACPIFWIIAAFIVLTTVVDKIARSFDKTSDSVVSAMNDTTEAIDNTALSIDEMGTSISVLDQKYRNLTSGAAYVCGAIGGVAAFTVNVVGAAWNLILDTGKNIYNFFADMINDGADIFTDFTGGVGRSVTRLVDWVYSALQSIASVFDMLFGSSIGFELADWWQKERDRLQKWSEETYGVGIEVVEKINEEDLKKYKFKQVDPQDWFNEAAAFGAKINEAFNGANFGGDVYEL